jgi:hypothetical protein
MTKKQYIGFMILAVVFLGGLFYWYSFGPSIIKKDCYNEAGEKAIELLKTKSEMLTQAGQTNDVYKKAIGKDLFLTVDFDNAYNNCLREKGL